MGDFARTYGSRWFLALSEGAIAALMTPNNCHSQATLSRRRLGVRGQLVLPRPAHLGVRARARPRIRDMIRDATIAGLLPEQPFLALGRPGRNLISRLLGHPQ